MLKAGSKANLLNSYDAINKYTIKYLEFVVNFYLFYISFGILW